MASVTKRPKEEMARLWQEWVKTRDPAIKNILSEEYYPIVRYVAEKMIERLPHNVQVEDLVSSGVFGLFDAITKFDLERGVKFETYCVNRIRGAMLDELRHMDWVPRLTRARANKLEDAYARLEKENGRAPTDVELARELKISVDHLDELFREVSGASLVSMQRRSLAKDPNQLGVDIMEDQKIEGPFPATQRKDLLEFCKKRLSTKERYILMMYYSEDLTLKEIGQILDLSESRVCQLHAKLISRLRAYLKTKKVEIA
ncbi:MAG TPA: FliA/WhiG family RNA polymerase sigma factor [Planctomycetota bacterium]|nr:FliA/WhiG family RNA polymerase sigma factor [Planctomycetota bacterium]